MARIDEMKLSTFCVCLLILFSVSIIHCPFSSILKKSSFWILLFVAFIIFSSAEGDDVRTVKKKKREKRLRNKAEIAPAEVVQKQSEINQKIDLNEKYEQLEVSAPGAYGAEKYNDDKTIPSYDDDDEDSEEDLDEEIDIVMADVDEAEEEDGEDALEEEAEECEADDVRDDAAEEEEPEDLALEPDDLEPDNFSVCCASSI